MADFQRHTFHPPVNELWRLLRYRYFSKQTKIEGTAQEICDAVIEQCWNGTFYQTSTGNFTYFWVRDFGSVAESLCALGHTDRVHTSLKWALAHYMESNAITLCITSEGRLFDSPTRGIDTLPWLMHAIWASGYRLTSKERSFLVEKLREYQADFIEPATGNLISQIGAAELRDGVLYDRSAYAVTLIGHMAKCVVELGMADAFPYAPGIYRNLLIREYWNGHYFDADMRTKAFSAECALMPFALGLVDDADMLERTLDYIRDHDLSLPHAMKYTDTPRAFHYRFWAKTVMANYAGDTIWTWHGAYYMRLLRQLNRPEFAECNRAFTEMVERFGTFPELLHPDGTLYKSLIYKSSAGMIWAALYIDL